MKIYILTGRRGTEFFVPIARKDYGELYEIMKDSYETTRESIGNFPSQINELSAIIESDDEWIEWQINIVTLK